MTISSNIHHVLLDIEGTTCPVTFVGDVLFPYAAEQLLPYLKQHYAQAPIRTLLKEIYSAWQLDTSPEAIALSSTVSGFTLPVCTEDPTGSADRAHGGEAIGADVRAESGDSSGSADRAHGGEAIGADVQAESGHSSGSGQPEGLSPEDACIYLNWLIKQDRKLTALKDLQGLIWEQGYQDGTLVAPLFSDVPEALSRWHHKGIQLSVYSSGSIQAQKLLYSHTNHGDLSHLFSHWFDTRTGAKNQTASYVSIARALRTNPEHVLFISDVVDELKAASSAQMTVLLSRRPGNTPCQAEGFPMIDDFSML
jgi:enolase-phosphatase E1